MPNTNYRTRINIIVDLELMKLLDWRQSWGLRPRSYDKTCLSPAWVLVLCFWSCLQHCCAWQGVWHDNAEMY